MDLQALKSELTADPLGRGYSGMSDEAAAESLNTRDREQDRDAISGGDVAACVTLADFTASGITNVQRQWLQLLSSASSLTATAHLKASLRALFPQGSDTRSNLVALLKRTGSRAEELGLGNVTPSHVADARRL